MSQQEMQFENPQQVRTGAYDGAYEAFPRDYEASHYNQKLTEPTMQRTRENDHLREHQLNLRMGMAVVSLILWLVLFFISLAVLLHNQTPSIVQPFIFMGTNKTFLIEVAVP